MTPRLWPEQLKGGALDRDEVLLQEGRLGWGDQELSSGPGWFNLSTRHSRGDTEWAIGHEFVAHEGSFVVVRD